jgi:hypothetical protein
VSIKNNNMIFMKSSIFLPSRVSLSKRGRRLEAACD